MSPEEKRKLFTEPLEHLIFTDWFIQKAKLMHFETLYDIIYMKEKDLMKKEGFCQVWYMELIEFLHKRGILDILESNFRF